MSDTPHGGVNTNWDPELGYGEYRPAYHLVAESVRHPTKHDTVQLEISCDTYLHSKHMNLMSDKELADAMDAKHRDMLALLSVAKGRKQLRASGRDLLNLYSPVIDPETYLSASETEPDVTDEIDDPSDKADATGNPSDKAVRQATLRTRQSTGNPSDKADAAGSPSDKADAAGNPSDKADAAGNPSDKADAAGNPIGQGSGSGNRPPSDKAVATGPPLDKAVATGIPPGAILPVRKKPPPNAKQPSYPT